MRRGRGARPRWAGAAARIGVLLTAPLLAQGAAAQPSEAAGDPNAAEITGLDEVVLPGLPRGLLHLWLGSGLAPAADAGGSEVGFTRPEARISLQGPIGQRASAKLFAAFASSLYDVDDGAHLFSGCAECPTPDEFQSASFGVQGALLLNDGRYLFRSGENWALVGQGFWRARWESGAFERSQAAGSVVGLAYEIPEHLRVALGAQVEVAFDGGSVSLRPTGMLRWDITPSLRLRNRGLGAELSLQALRRLELFAAGYRNSERFQLHSRTGLPASSSFSDRRWQIGAGFEWRLWRWLRLRTEAGALVDRRLSVRANGEGNLDSVNVDPSPYVDVRLELRP